MRREAEAVARVLYDEWRADTGRNLGEWDQLQPLQREAWGESAKAAIAALDAHRTSQQEDPKEEGMGVEKRWFNI